MLRKLQFNLKFLKTAWNRYLLRYVFLLLSRLYMLHFFLNRIHTMCLCGDTKKAFKDQQFAFKKCLQKKIRHHRMPSYLPALPLCLRTCGHALMAALVGQTVPSFSLRACVSVSCARACSSRSPTAFCFQLRTESFSPKTTEERKCQDTVLIFTCRGRSRGCQPMECDYCVI